MKATLEFNLDDPSDKRAHARCAKATEAYIALFNIDNKLREYVKYEKGISPGSTWNLPDGSCKLTEHESSVMWHLAHQIRKEIAEIVQDLGVNLDDLE